MYMEAQRNPENKELAQKVEQMAQKLNKYKDQFLIKTKIIDGKIRIVVTIEKEEFVKLRTKKEDEFVEKASRIIDKALNRLERSLDDKNEKIPVNNLSTVIGTLYDKKALAKGDPTANTDIHIKMDKKVEELSQ